LYKKYKLPAGSKGETKTMAYVTGWPSVPYPKLVEERPPTQKPAKKK
jgi:hypothetical protein